MAAKEHKTQAAFQTLQNRALKKITFKKHTYGTKSLTNNCIKDWNNFKRSFADLLQGELTYHKIKSVLKDHILNQH